jgi:hypothetical protein
MPKPYDPVAQRARNRLWTAISNGSVKRGDTCESCGFRPRDRSLVHGHHDDYSKPLEVRWLCASCHKRHHLGLPLIGDPRRNHPIASRGAAA